MAKTEVAKDTDTANAATHLRNYNEEFMKAWAMLLIDTFDKESEKQTKFYADLKLETTANPFGSNFGTIYKDLALADKTKADAEIEKICYNAKEKMYLPKTAALLKSMVAGKYYALNLGTCTDTCVKVQPLMKLGEYLMPFHAEGTQAMKDIDAQ